MPQNLYTILYCVQTFACISDPNRSRPGSIPIFCGELGCASTLGILPGKVLQKPSLVVKVDRYGLYVYEGSLQL